MSSIRFASVRPLVRYVDEDQAVIDAHVATLPPVPEDEPFSHPVVDVYVSVDTADGFHDEGEVRLALQDGRGSFRFEVVQPSRWWPAGMGDQSLYELTLVMLADGSELDRQTLTFGMTSVRRDQTSLLVNGQACRIGSVVTVDRIQEQRLLPAAGDSLLLVRDHYGTEQLYDAADRAGILLIQCVPISAAGEPLPEVLQQLDRLTGHPSLAGYFVGHLGAQRQSVAKRIRDLDPTRAVFEDLPMMPAA